MKRRIIANLTPEQISAALCEYVGRTRQLPLGTATNWTIDVRSEGDDVSRAKIVQGRVEFDYEENSVASNEEAAL